MLVISNLEKSFGTTRAVDNLSLKVGNGEIYGFIGPNGAGKTTTIKMITGVLQPDKGTVVLGGKDLAKEPVEVKRLIGYIPDDPYVYPELSGREILYLAGKLFGVTDLKKKVEDLVKIYDLEEIIDHNFASYSRGNKQKTAILAAFLHEPKLLVVDEPIVGLDPESARITIDLFADFAKDGGSIFVSTHTLSVVEKIAHRVGIIDKGRLIFEGKRKELEKKLKRRSGSLESLYLELTRKK